jgi:hypothetical protein
MGSQEICQFLWCYDDASPFHTSLDYRPLFDTSRLVKNKNELRVPVLIDLHKLGPKEHGRSEHIEPIIASYGYRFDIVDSVIAPIRYCFWRKRALKKYI